RDPLCRCRLQHPGRPRGRGLRHQGVSVVKFFRSILGTAEGEPQAEGEASAREDAVARPASVPDDATEEAKHELDVQKDFSRGLSDLGQRQLQYEQYRWEPPTQTDPRGTWFVTEEVETDDLV